MPTIKEVSQEEFDAVCERMDAQRRAVAAAKRLIDRAKTPGEKIAAAQILSAARRMPVA